METKCQAGIPSSNQIFLLQVGLIYIGTLQVSEVPTSKLINPFRELQVTMHMGTTAGC